MEYASKYGLTFSDFIFDEGTWKVTTEGMEKVLEEEKKKIQDEINNATTARKKQVGVIRKGVIAKKNGPDTNIDDYIREILPDNKNDA
jgi:hypothetical protein